MEIADKAHGIDGHGRVKKCRAVRRREVGDTLAPAIRVVIQRAQAAFRGIGELFQHRFSLPGRFAALHPRKIEIARVVEVCHLRLDSCEIRIL